MFLLELIVHLFDGLHYFALDVFLVQLLGHFESLLVGLPVLLLLLLNEHVVGLQDLLDVEELVVLPLDGRILQFGFVLRHQSLPHHISPALHLLQLILLLLLHHFRPFLQHVPLLHIAGLPEFRGKLAELSPFEPHALLLDWIVHSVFDVAFVVEDLEDVLLLVSLVLGPFIGALFQFFLFLLHFSIVFLGGIFPVLRALLFFLPQTLFLSPPSLFSAPIEEVPDCVEGVGDMVEEEHSLVPPVVLNQLFLAGNYFADVLDLVPLDWGRHRLLGLLLL